jgi:hypothetical protein
LSFEGRFRRVRWGLPDRRRRPGHRRRRPLGGNGEQDTKCGLAALQALQDLLVAQKHVVQVEADIKK